MTLTGLISIIPFRITSKPIHCLALPNGSGLVRFSHRNGESVAVNGTSLGRPVAMENAFFSDTPGSTCGKTGMLASRMRRRGPFPLIGIWISRERKRTGRHSRFRCIFGRVSWVRLFALYGKRPES